jgi:uncharacterized protein
MKNNLNAIIIAASIVFTGLIFSNAFKNRNQSNETISVTGLGKKDFTSDLIVWNSLFSRKNMQLKEAYALLDNDRKIIKEYFASKGIPDNEIVFSAVEINKEYEYNYDNFGNTRQQIFTGYYLTQRIQIESKSVDKIEEISRSVTELINLGVELNSYSPQYYYTKLAELKLEMIAEATKDAKARAEKIAENSGARLGHLKKSEMGVFQIIAQNSAEDYSWGGSFNTSSKNKEANITMKLIYQID